MQELVFHRQEIAFAVAAYDDCIADLDEQIGRLFDELGPRGVLEQTWVIITSDHGESFGEHAGHLLPRHQSLSDRAARAAARSFPPGCARPSRSSTRREPAGPGGDDRRRDRSQGRPRRFPASRWPDIGTIRHSPGRSGTQHLIPRQPNWPCQASRPAEIRHVCPESSWPLGGLKDGEWSYIRHEGDQREELFRLRRRRQGAAQPGRRSYREAGARADASNPGPNHGWATLAAAVQPLRIATGITNSKAR